MRVRTPMASLSHMICSSGGLLLCYDGIRRSHSQIDNKNDFSGPINLWKDIESHGYISKLIFLTVLAASGGLNAILGGNHYSKPLEHGRNGFSNSKKQTNRNDISHMRFWGQHLASGGLRFEKCRTLVLKSVGTWGLWIISERMKFIS